MRLKNRNGFLVLSSCVYVVQQQPRNTIATEIKNINKIYEIKTIRLYSIETGFQTTTTTTMVCMYTFCAAFVHCDFSLLIFIVRLFFFFFFSFIYSILSLRTHTHIHKWRDPVLTIRHCYASKKKKKKITCIKIKQNNNEIELLVFYILLLLHRPTDRFLSSWSVFSALMNVSLCVPVISWTRFVQRRVLFVNNFFFFLSLYHSDDPNQILN